MEKIFSTPPQSTNKLSPSLMLSPLKLSSSPRSESPHAPCNLEDQTPPHCAVQEEELWSDAFSCMTSKVKECDSEEGSDFETEEFALKRQMPTLARLPTGELHACRVGSHCPFLIPNDDRVMVCMYSGLEHGPEHTDEHFDINGGNGKKTGDPDINSGEPVNGKWTKRADPVQASRHAFEASKNFCDDGTFPYVHCPEDVSKLGKGRQKRSALCVGEEVEDVGVKRNRGGKKNTNRVETRINLVAEAESVILKMVDHKQASSYKQKARDGKSDRRCAAVDPRMMDESFVFNNALKRYVKNCTISEDAPSLDTIHNLSLMARAVSEQAKRSEEETLASDAVRTVKFRTNCSLLIVSLWRAACATPYMKNAKRGTDAYRPFVCGALYALKRGLNLPNGTILLPQCPQLALALPVLRGTGGNSVAKTLHSSSHRGMCTLSRCIASVPVSEHQELFADVARVAVQFASHRFSKWDV